VTNRIVLIADDSATIRTLVRLELETAGYDVLQAADGHAAVDAARTSDVCVVLLDVQMLGQDGHAALTELKADARTRDIPVVFLSGSTGDDDLVAALRGGAHDYLRKPPVPAELRARVAAACRVKKLQDQLRERVLELDSISRTDHLTGLHNRRHAEEHLAACVAASRRHGYPLAVLLVDIDNFKQVNDTRGHTAGDDVLFEVAQVLSREVRTEDVVARWGGEEFIVVGLHADEDAAMTLAERLRSAVAERCGVTVSIGAAAAVGLDTQLRAAADRNLFAAKEAGRDRCVVSGAS
jgi:diguanylate cyclase (GGDEF)-like protein